MIDKDQFDYWRKKDPVTKAFFLYMEHLLNQSAERIGKINLLEDHLEARMGVERGYQLAIGFLNQATDDTLNQVLESKED